MTLKSCIYSLKVSAITLILAATPQVNAQASLAGTRPNIIVVLTDDQGFGDLSAFGNTYLDTPHLDAFYEESLRFVDFHVSPTCAPSRASIMTGQHEFKVGVTHTIRRRENMALSAPTIAEVLQDAGYSTGLFGKWHLGDDEPFLPQNRGFREVLMHGAGGPGQRFGKDQSDFPPNRNPKNRLFDLVLLHNDTIVQSKGYCTDVFFQASLGWMKQELDAKRPFFAYIALNAPHAPHIAPKKYLAKHLANGWEPKMAARNGIIENIDDNMGLLMQKLTEWDALDNTLVIFMTDNGQDYYFTVREGYQNTKGLEYYMAGARTGKGGIVECGTRVPSFWNWKGKIPEGVDVPALTAHIDLFKTFAELAGATLPEDSQEIDGRTLLPLLENQNSEWPDRKLFFHKGRWDKEPESRKYEGHAVRTERWRLAQSERMTDNKLELYDIANDPRGVINVIEQYPEVADSLKADFEAWWDEVRPFMINDDKPLKFGTFPLVQMYNKQKNERGIPDYQPLPF